MLQFSVLFLEHPKFIDVDALPLEAEEDRTTFATLLVQKGFAEWECM